MANTNNNENKIVWKNAGYGTWKDSSGNFVIKERVSASGKTYAMFDEKNGYSYEGSSIEDCTRYAEENFEV